MFSYVDGVLITAGEKGCSYCFKNDINVDIGSIPGFKVDTIDTTGAGDAFTAGFIYQLLKVKYQLLKFYFYVNLLMISFLLHCPFILG